MMSDAATVGPNHSRIFRRRRARPQQPFCFLAALVILSVVFGCNRAAQQPVVLTVACAASLQEPVTQLARLFEADNDVKIQLQFGGTSMLVNQQQLTRNADVLISADGVSTERLISDNLATVRHGFAKQVPVIACSPHYVHAINSCTDLLNPRIRLGLGDSKVTSIGVATVAALGGDSDRLYEHAVVTRTTVTALATDLKLGSIDAAIVWDSTARTFQLPMFVDSDLTEGTQLASVCILTGSKQSDNATQFAEFLTSSPEAAEILQKLRFHLPQRPARNLSGYRHKARQELRGGREEDAESLDDFRYNGVSCHGVPGKAASS